MPFINTYVNMELPDTGASSGSAQAIAKAQNIKLTLLWSNSSTSSVFGA